MYSRSYLFKHRQTRELQRKKKRRRKMRNYPVVLRNYLFLMGIFSTLPNDSEGTRTLSSISHCSKSGIFLSYISNSLNLFVFSEKAFGEGSIGEFLYVNFMMNEFSYLNITSIGRNLIEDEDDCAFACLNIPSCFSYNMAPFPDDNGKLLCELLPSDKYNNSDKFITNKEFHHFHIPVGETPFM